MSFFNSILSFGKSVWNKTVEFIELTLEKLWEIIRFLFELAVKIIGGIIGGIIGAVAKFVKVISICVAVAKNFVLSQRDKARRLKREREEIERKRQEQAEKLRLFMKKFADSRNDEEKNEIAAFVSGIEDSIKKDKDKEKQIDDVIEACGQKLNLYNDLENQNITHMTAALNNGTVIPETIRSYHDTAHDGRVENLYGPEGHKTFDLTEITY